MSTSPSTMIISFYSYKGGVGRTMLCANIAAYLCYKMKKKVLLWDWDMEAPGLHYYFQKKKEGKEGKEEENELLQPLGEGKRGTIDLLDDFVRESLGKGVGYADFKLPEAYPIVPAAVDRGQIDILPAGEYGNGYVSKVNDFNWRDFYEIFQGAAYIDYLKKWVKEQGYDYVLIDSRTGINDYSGVCNIHLPDLNVVVMTPNRQNMEGSKRVIDQITSSPYIKDLKKRKPYIFPVLSRLDAGNPNRDHWVNKFVSTFHEHLTPLDKNIKEATPFAKSIFRDVFMEETLLEYSLAYSAGEILLPTSDHQLLGSGLLRKYANISSYLENLRKDRSTNIYRRISAEQWLQWARDVDYDYPSSSEADKDRLRAIAYTEAGEYEKAIEHGGTVRAYLELAKRDMKNANYDEAIEKYKAAAAMNQIYGDEPEKGDALIGLANCYDAQKNHAEREKILKELESIAEQNTNPAMLETIGNLFKEFGKHEIALSVYQKSEKIYGDATSSETMALRESIGDCFLKLRRYNEVLKYYKKLDEELSIEIKNTKDKKEKERLDGMQKNIFIGMSGIYVESLKSSTRGQTTLSGNDRDIIEKFFKKATKFEGNLQLYLNVGWYYLLTNRAEKALINFKQARNINRNNHLVYEALAALYEETARYHEQRGESNAAQENYEKAIGHYETAYERMTNKEDKARLPYHEKIAEIYVKAERDSKEIIQIIETYYLNSGFLSPDMVYWKAEAHFNIGEIAAAFNLLAPQFRQKDKETKLEEDDSRLFEDSIAVQNGTEADALAYSLLGRIYAAVDDHAKSILYWADANRISPDAETQHLLAQGYLRYAQEQEKQKETDEANRRAKDLLLSLLEVKEESDAYVLAHKYSLLCDAGVALDYCGQDEAAVEKFKTAIQYNAQEDDAYLKLASWHFDKEQYEDASRILNDLLTQNKEAYDPDVYYNKARTLFALKSYKEALATLKNHPVLDDLYTIVLTAVCQMFAEYDTSCADMLEEGRKLLNAQIDKNRVSTYESPALVNRRRQLLKESEARLEGGYVCLELFKGDDIEARNHLLQLYFLVGYEKADMRVHLDWFIPNLTDAYSEKAAKLERLMKEIIRKN